MGGAIVHMTCVLIKRKIWVQTCTRGECRVNGKAEVGVMCLQAQNTPDWQKPPEARGGA